VDEENIDGSHLQSTENIIKKAQFDGLADIHKKLCMIINPLKTNSDENKIELLMAGYDNAYHPSHGFFDSFESLMIEFGQSEITFKLTETHSMLTKNTKNELKSLKLNKIRLRDYSTNLIANRYWMFIGGSTYRLNFRNPRATNEMFYFDFFE